MKKQAFLFVFFTVTLLIASYAVIQSAFAQTDFNAYKGAEIDDNQIDGAIGTEWDDAAKYTGVAIDPKGTATIWIKNDGANLYIAYQFTADSNNPWTAVQLGGNSCMEGGADAGLFGNDDYPNGTNGYVDIYMSGTGAARADASQHGKGAITVDSSYTVTVELKKTLNSSDTAGNDINWKLGENHTLVIIWDSNGFGSSGGTASHSSRGTALGTATVRSVLINSNQKPAGAADGQPEIPALTYVVTLVAVISLVVIAVLAIFLKRKR